MNLSRLIRIPFQGRLRFGRYYFADQPVDLDHVGELRRDRLPDAGPFCWLDRPDAFLQIDRKRAKGAIDETAAEMCREWVVQGYTIVEKLFDDATLDAAWAAYEAALADGRLGEVAMAEGGVFPDRKLDPHMAVPEVAALMHHPDLLRITDLLLGRKTVPFQTIMGHAGSQQSAHSDAIHMTTYPLGFMVANWVAFEDIHDDSGPLDYYPKSHRLPYMLSAEAGIPPAAFKQRGYDTYAESYEPMIRECCAKYGFERKVFRAKKGDVLFWHANLIHGGAARADLARSRKALVCHHFAEGAVTYHDLSGNPSRLHAKGFYAPVVSQAPYAAGAGA
jgi:ectoine hydroxylase-related dioxygenase (phytanoyl-CoA dioxygenase family)